MSEKSKISHAGVFQLNRVTAMNNKKNKKSFFDRSD
jgi:hypothetical protein